MFVHYFQFTYFEFFISLLNILRAPSFLLFELLWVVLASLLREGYFSVRHSCLCLHAPCSRIRASSANFCTRKTQSAVSVHNSKGFCLIDYYESNIHSFAWFCPGKLCSMYTGFSAQKKIVLLTWYNNVGLVAIIYADILCYFLSAKRKVYDDKNSTQAGLRATIMTIRIAFWK